MFLPFNMQIREVIERFQICLYKDCFARVFSLLKISSMLQVGTVLNVEDAVNAINAGAKFLISPAMVKVCALNSTFSFSLGSSSIGSFFLKLFYIIQNKENIYILCKVQVQS